MSRLLRKFPCPRKLINFLAGFLAINILIASHGFPSFQMIQTDTSYHLEQAINQPMHLLFMKLKYENQTDQATWSILLHIGMSSYSWHVSSCITASDEDLELFLNLNIWFFSKLLVPMHSQCVTNIEVSQTFSSWSNIGRLRFDQHLVKWLTFDQPMTIGDIDRD